MTNHDQDENLSSSNRTQAESEIEDVVAVSGEASVHEPRGFVDSEADAEPSQTTFEDSSDVVGETNAHFATNMSPDTDMSGNGEVVAELEENAEGMYESLHEPELHRERETVYADVHNETGPIHDSTDETAQSESLSTVVVEETLADANGVGTPTQISQQSSVDDVKSRTSGWMKGLVDKGVKLSHRIDGISPDFMSIKIKIGGSFLAVLIVLMILGLVSMVRLGSLQGEVDQLANHDMLVVQYANNMEEDLLTMEGAMRSYLVTGNDAVLQTSFQPAQQSFASDHTKLATLTKNDSASAKLLDGATTPIKEWITYAQKLINMRNIGQGLQADGIEASGAGTTMETAAMTNLKELVQTNQTQASAAAKSLSGMVLSTRIIIVVLSLLAIAIAVMLGGRVTLTTPKNLKRVISILDDIASAGGDLRTRITGVASKDEIQQLAESTNRLLETVGQVVKRVVDTSEAVAASAEQLTASTDETARAVSSIAETAGEFASISDQAMTALKDMDQSANAVQAQGHVVTSKVTDVASAVDAVVSSTEQGRSLVAQALDMMNQLQTSTTETASRIRELETSSQKIAKISVTIRGIADQTNLLSLNAAIEAARAGEAGRGFAVVAQEVRMLAEQSRDATREIEQIIKENNKVTVQVSESMDAGVQSVIRGAEVTGRTSAAFDQIRLSVNEVVPTTKQILDSVTEQDQLTQQTVKAIQDVITYMEHVAAGSEENAAGTQETLATVEEIAASSHALARLAEQLQDVVGKFQV